jgi:hypothetical protein
MRFFLEAVISVGCCPEQGTFVVTCKRVRTLNARALATSEVNSAMSSHCRGCLRYARPGVIYCFGVKPDALMAGSHSSESLFWIFLSSSGVVPVA